MFWKTNEFYKGKIKLIDGRFYFFHSSSSFCFFDGILFIFKNKLLKILIRFLFKGKFSFW
ncbi:MAG: hypothetical protein CMC96_01875 [Flavobacteriales bacterium]|nr:hypothetical protein [Flavobacteriales bacterium]